MSIISHFNQDDFLIFDLVNLLQWISSWTSYDQQINLLQIICDSQIEQRVVKHD